MASGSGSPHRRMSPWLAKFTHHGIMYEAVTQLPRLEGSSSGEAAAACSKHLFMASASLGAESCGTADSCWEYPVHTEQLHLQNLVEGLSLPAAVAVSSCPGGEWPAFFRRACAAVQGGATEPTQGTPTPPCSTMPRLCAALVAPSMWATESSRDWPGLLQAAALQAPYVQGFRSQEPASAAAGAAHRSAANGEWAGGLPPLSPFVASPRGSSGVLPGDSTVLGGLHQWLVTVDEPVFAVLDPCPAVLVGAGSEAAQSAPAAPAGMQVRTGRCEGLSPWWHSVQQALRGSLALVEDSVSICSSRVPGDYDSLCLLPRAVASPGARRAIMQALFALAAPGMWRVEVDGRATGADSGSTVQLLLFHPWVLLARVLLLKLQLTCRWWKEQLKTQGRTLDSKLMNAHVERLLQWQTDQLRSKGAARSSLTLQPLPALHVLLSQICMHLHDPGAWCTPGCSAWEEFTAQVATSLEASSGAVLPAAALAFTLKVCHGSLLACDTAASVFQAVMPSLRASAAGFGHPALQLCASEVPGKRWALLPEVYTWGTRPPAADLSAQELSVYGKASAGKQANPKGALLFCMLFVWHAQQLDASASASAQALLDDFQASSRAAEHRKALEVPVKMPTGPIAMDPAVEQGHLDGGGTTPQLQAVEGQGAAAPSSAKALSQDAPELSEAYRGEISCATRVMAVFEGGLLCHSAWNHSVALAALHILERAHRRDFQGAKELSEDVCLAQKRELGAGQKFCTIWLDADFIELCSACSPRCAIARQLCHEQQEHSVAQLHVLAAFQSDREGEAAAAPAAESIPGAVSLWYSAMGCLGHCCQAAHGVGHTTQPDATADATSSSDVQKLRLFESRRLSSLLSQLRVLSQEVKAAQEVTVDALSTCMAAVSCLVETLQCMATHTCILRSMGVGVGVLGAAAARAVLLLGDELQQLLQRPVCAAAPRQLSDCTSLQQVLDAEWALVGPKSVSAASEALIEATWASSTPASPAQPTVALTPRVEILAAHVSTKTVLVACHCIVRALVGCMAGVGAGSAAHQSSARQASSIPASRTWNLPFPSAKAIFRSGAELGQHEQQLAPASALPPLEPELEIRPALQRHLGRSLTMHLQIKTGTDPTIRTADIACDSSVHLPAAIVGQLSEADQELYRKAQFAAPSRGAASGLSPVFARQEERTSPVEGAAFSPGGAAAGEAASAHTVPEYTGADSTLPLPAAAGLQTPLDKVDLLPQESIEQLDSEVSEMAFEIGKIAAAVRTHKASLVAKVSQLAKTLWPSCRVEVFGSFATGLDLPGSDVDCVVCDVEEHYSGIMRGLSSPSLPKLLEKLRAAHWVLSAEAVTQTAVPVIKILAESGQHNSANIRMDISFDGPRHRGISTAAYIRQAASQHPALAPVSLVFKHMLVTHNLNEPYLGGLSSYAVVLLVLAVLKEYPALPSVLTDLPQVRTNTTKASAAQLRADIADALYADSPPKEQLPSAVSQAVVLNTTATPLTPRVNLGKALIHVLELAARLCANAKYWALDVKLGALYRRGTQFQDDPLVIVDPNERTNNVGKAAWGFEAVQSTLMASVRRLASRRYQYQAPLSQKHSSLLGAIFDAHHHRDVVELIRQVWLKQTSKVHPLDSEQHPAAQPGSLSLETALRLLNEVRTWNIGQGGTSGRGLPQSLAQQIGALLQAQPDHGIP